MLFHRLARSTMPLTLVALLGACAADLAEQDYRLGHPVAVEQRQLHALFDRRDEPGELSGLDQERLRRLAAESLRRGAGNVIINSPDADFAQSLADYLKTQGVAAVTVAAGGSPSEAVVDVPVWVARLPECGQFERGVNPDYDNMPHSNWGCALQRNRAAMVQDPADLIRAREPGGRDGNRAADVIDKYQRGVATGSAQESVTAGSASSVGH